MATLYEVHIKYPPADKEAVSDCLRHFGVQSFVESFYVAGEEGGPESPDGELVAEAMDKGEFICYFESPQEVDDLQQTFKQQFLELSRQGELSLTVKLLKQEDWQNVWKKFWHPIEISKRLCICPEWEKFSPLPGQHVLTINPEMAFGTGTHETTKMCLSLLDDRVFSRPAPSLLDIGCGSGILSVAAAVFGIQRVLGIDVDPVAVETARENARRNGVCFCEFMQIPVTQVRERFSVICVNIISSIIIPMWQDILARLEHNGQLIVSGILVEERERFISHVARQPLEYREQGAWCAFLF